MLGQIKLGILAFFISVGVQAETKPTWALNYDSKEPIRTADWVDYLRLTFDPNQTNLFSAVDPSITSFDYGLFNESLGGGHIARAAQHALTYGNYMVGRRCLEQAIANYMTSNGITVNADKFFYQQGYWPMRNAGIISSDSTLTKVSKALKGLHGGDLVYSRIQSNGPENGSEVVTLNCTVCHESRALVPTTSGQFKAVRQPWGAEGYVTKNLKLMTQAAQEAISLAAQGHACASGPESHLYAALYEIRKAKHTSTNPDGTQAFVDLNPANLITAMPDSAFYNPSGAVAHTVVNMLVNKGSWTYGKPMDIDQAYQLFRPEDVLSNNQFFPILKANFNTFYGINRDGRPAPANFSLNSAWSEKFYTPTDNMFHGMGCSYINESGTKVHVACSIVEKAILLSAATNSQALNPDLSSDTLNRFPGVSPYYKWPLRKYSGTDGVFERTTELFVGLAANGGNPMVNEIVQKRAMTYETVANGSLLFNQRCASCHGTSGISLDIKRETNNATLNPGNTDTFLAKDALRNVPSNQYIANVKAQPFVQEDSVRDLVMKNYDGYRGDISYQVSTDPKKVSVKNLVGVALEQRFGCYLDLDQFLQRSVPAAIQVSTPKLNVSTTAFGYTKEITYANHTAANETAALQKQAYRIFWMKEHPECGPLSSAGAAQPNQFYDHPFHAGVLDGSNSAYPKLTATQRKYLIDFLILISFNGAQLPSSNGTINVTLLSKATGYGIGGFKALDGNINKCSSSCAKFGDSCNLTSEANMLNPDRKCCGEVSDSIGTAGKLQTMCATEGTVTSWRFCRVEEQDSDCGKNYLCVEGRCLPKSSVPAPSPSATPVVSPSPAPSPSPSVQPGLPEGASCFSNSQCTSGSCYHGECE